jgi:hypothetical protein
MLVRTLHDVGQEDPEEVFASVVRFEPAQGAYEVLVRGAERSYMTPLEVENSILPPDAPLLVDAEGLKACHPNLEFSFAVDNRPVFCTLDSQGAPDDLQDGRVQVRVRRVQRAAQSSMTLRFGSTTKPRGSKGDFFVVSLWIDVRHILRTPGQDDDEYCPSVDFVRPQRPSQSA